MKSTNGKQAVIEVVAALPQGARVDAIAARLPGIPRRTLQRLLAELVQIGQLTRSGKGPATLYTLGQQSPAVEVGGGLHPLHSPFGYQPQPAGAIAAATGSPHTRWPISANGWRTTSPIKPTT
jgi:hypothetical protein